MSLTYLLINLAIISVPLWYTPDKRVGYYRQLPAVSFSILVVGSCYLLWDILVTARGEWSFNSIYLTGIEILKLPLEEILFFITVPYSCLFIYEVVLYSTKNSRLKIPNGVVIAVIVLLTAASIAFYRQGYTMKALLSCAVFLAATQLLDRSLIRSKQYWLWLVVCYIPFTIFNSVLTALPVVEYHSAAIWGVRLGTIPLEDLFYNYAMLSFYLLFYRMIRRETANERDANY
ncbi:MAG TPA: lycopene cyclase domain-containing protein [Candidatus Binatia bacterium]